MHREASCYPLYPESVEPALPMSDLPPGVKVPFCYSRLLVTCFSGQTETSAAFPVTRAGQSAKFGISVSSMEFSCDLEIRFHG